MSSHSNRADVGQRAGSLLAKGQFLIPPKSALARCSVGPSGGGKIPLIQSMTPHFQGPLQAFSLPCGKARNALHWSGPHVPPARSLHFNQRAQRASREGRALHRRQVAPERRPRRARARWAGRPRGPALTLGAAGGPG